MDDHDQRMKSALREFLAEFVALALAAWLTRFDLTAPHWLPQEVFVNPPKGERRVVDLLAKVPVMQPLGAFKETLLHVEIESGESLSTLRERMPRYRAGIRSQHNLPVLSLALYLYVGLEGVGWDEATSEYWEEETDKTRWAYLGLPKLDALKYVEVDNILGVALSVLMKVPGERKAWLKARALQRIMSSTLSQARKAQLGEIVEAYLPLNEPHLSEYDRLLQTEEFKMARELGWTSGELAQKGFFRAQLEGRFGPLDEVARQRFESLSPKRILELGLAFHQATSLADLGLEGSATGTTPS